MASKSNRRQSRRVNRRASRRRPSSSSKEAGRRRRSSRRAGRRASSKNKNKKQSKKVRRASRRGGRRASMISNKDGSWLDRMASGVMRFLSPLSPRGVLPLRQPVHVDSFHYRIRSPFDFLFPRWRW
jgi:hypothetical protein